MPFDLDDAEDAIDRLERAVDELRMSLEKLADRFDVIEPRANRTYNFLWARMRARGRGIGLRRMADCRK